MKVLHLTDDLNMVGGVQSYLAMLPAVLADQGVECELWAPEPGPLQGRASRWFGRRYRGLVRDLIRRHRPDVLHAHNLWMRLSPAPLGVAREAAVPVIVTVHDYNWVCPRKWMIGADDEPCEAGFGWRCAVRGCRGSREGGMWLIYNALRWLKTSWHRRMLVRWVDLFISPSRHLARWMERSLGVDRIVRIPNCAHGPEDASLHPVADPGALLFAGRLSREKGVDVLLRAMPQVLSHHPLARLVIAGDGGQRPVLERLVRDLEIERAVRFVGAQGLPEMSRLYDGCGLVVLPTMWTENCPVSVLEAFAHRRGVVASRVGGVPELVVEPETGVTFERGDHRELATRLVELLDDPARIEAIGRGARARWEGEYTPELHGRRLRAAYDRVLSRNG